jgi:hypothetical protein
MKKSTYTISYGAQDNSIEGLSDGEKSYFLNWVETELGRQFPDHEIEINADLGAVHCTDDPDISDQTIGDICDSVRDACPWDEEELRKWAAEWDRIDNL